MHRPTSERTSKDTRGIGKGNRKSATMAPISIYAITCLDNGKKYVGQSSQPDTRFKTHLRSNKGRIHADVLRFGKDNFTLDILEKDIKVISYANTREGHYIELYKTTDRNKGYNVIKTAPCRA